MILLGVMKILLRTKIRSGYIIAFLLLLVSYFLIFFTVGQLIKGTKNVTESYTHINRLESLRSAVVHAETSVRGYLITREVDFLMPYYSSAPQVGPLLEEIRNLQLHNSKQLVILDTLDYYVGQKLSFLQSEILEYQRTGLVMTGEIREMLETGRLAMERIHSQINDLKEKEEKLINTQRENLGGFFNSTNIIAITSLVIAIVTVIFSMVTYNRENKAKEKAGERVKLYQSELETKVDQLKKVNSELQELKQIEKFAATGRIARTIAHEVRNPLTNITLATEQLQEHPAMEGESAQLLEMVRRNASRIDQLVSDLLHSTRFAQLEFVKVDINKLLDETLELAQDRIELNHVKVVKHYSRESCMAPVDPSKLKIALLNIIVNAIEAVEKEKGMVSISTAISNGHCHIQIRDNGMGMDDESLQKIFEPYFTGKSNGNGLGLTNSQNIILNHKGKIIVKSKPGEGSVFEVTLGLNPPVHS